MPRLLSIAFFLILASVLHAHPHDDLAVESSDFVRQTLAHAKTLTHHRGLPHPSKEAAAHQSALEAAPTFTLADFLFYKTDLNLDIATETQLKQLLSNAANLAIWTEKTTGFHPTHALTWRKGFSKHHALLDLTSREVIYLTKDHHLRYNLTPAATKQLQALLQP